jgi:phage terminase small subunit
MAEIVNLRRARKAKDRAEKSKDAEANRVAHGTPKHLRDLAKARVEKDARDLERHKKD